MLCKTGLALGLAFVALVLAIINPSFKLLRSINNYVFVIDITQSMNVLDMTLAGSNASRLDFVRNLVSKTLGKLPCGSKASIALFANAELVPLYTPIEVCATYGMLQDTLTNLEWRMAWCGSSHLRLGL